MASLDDVLNQPEGTELPDEMLEGVSGGELDRIKKMILDARISKYEDQGKSLEELIAWYEETGKGHYDINPNGIWKWNDGYSPELMNDITEYLRQHW